MIIDKIKSRVRSFSTKKDYKTAVKEIEKNRAHPQSLLDKVTKILKIVKT